MLVRTVGIFVLLAVAVGSAHSKEVRLGPKALNVIPANGFCELSDDNKADHRMLEAIRGMVDPIGNKLIAMYADCRQLTDWRSGKRALLDNMTQYQTLTNLIEKPLDEAPEEIVKKACADMRAEGEKMTKDMVPDAQARAKAVMKKVQINSMQFLGVLEEVPGVVCYAALLQKFKAENGVVKSQITAFATSVVRDKVIYYYYLSPYVDPSSVTTALERLKGYYGEFRVANPM